MAFPFDLAESVSTIVATIIAVVALVISIHQTTISNRQSLYSRRIDWIIRIAGLISLYEANRKAVLELDPSEPYMAADFRLVLMTNNAWLEKIGAETLAARNAHSKHDSLTIFENMKTTAMESEMLFRKSISKPGGKFIYAYEELLEEMRRYALIIQKMTEFNKERIGGPTSVQGASSEIGEPQYRRILLAAIESTESAYLELRDQDVLTRAKKATKVFGFRK